LASSLLALIMARAVTTPLRELTGAAEKLADEQLPALVDSLRNPSGQDAEALAKSITPIEVEGNDEIGQLAHAFNAVQAVAVDVAAEQASTLRKGISEIFVNLARRNQVLIDRQIEFLDELEATEDDPDQLAQLYRLDHLATRMRRNAESLLVLAGVEPARTRTRPVPLFDVVRAAIGEVEDFSRIDLVAFDDVDVLGNSAVDLGHLLAELMDNAAHFSPPDTRVSIEGRNGHSGYVISITDSGIGMSDEQIGEANELLASPPPVGLALSRSLGFTVVARLAARYGVTVQLRAGERVGTGAIVHLPHTLIVSPNAPEPVEDLDQADVKTTVVASAMPEPMGEPVGAARAADDTADSTPDTFETVIRASWGENEPVDSDEVPVEGRPQPVPQGPASLRDALPQGQSFEKGLADLVEGEAALGPAQLIEPPVEGTAPADEPAPAASDDAAIATENAEQPAEAAPTDEVDLDEDIELDADEPAESEVTSNGLTRRVRKNANALEGVERFRAAPSGPSILATKRSPDDVRAMLARYRTGLQRGRVGDDPITKEPGSEG
jgi:signal transduction histidine kinase